MLKTIIILPDGTQLSSGLDQFNAVKDISVTECVNDGQELSLGSVCANMIELTAITPNGGLHIAAGDELQVFREDADGIRYKVGVFVSEKPVRQSANTLRITAFDRVCLSDKDLTDWFNGLKGWPYTLLQLSKMICEACGLELENTQIPNGNCTINKFEVSAITGRRLLQWAAQAAGRFCRATPEGKLEFAWYSPTAIAVAGTQADYAAVIWDEENGSCIDGSITTALDGAGDLTWHYKGITAEMAGAAHLQIVLPLYTMQLAYNQDSLSYADYQVAKIEKICIDCGEQISTVWPANLAEAVNTYTVAGNGFLTAASENVRLTVAQGLYEMLKNMTYTPCKFSMPASNILHAGDMISVTDRNGKIITTCVMTKKQTGQKDVLESTGSAHRDSSTAINALTLRDISGKVVDLKMTVEGIQVVAKAAAEQAASFTLDAQGIRSEVSRQQTELGGVKNQITALAQTADLLKISVSSVTENGVSQVKTETGYTFDEEGLTISKDGTEMVNTLDETGMYVKRNDEVILQANNTGVKAVDVSVGNYLIVGEHARFEDFSTGADGARTACFWI